jgi:hypothetical protein
MYLTAPARLQQAAPGMHGANLPLLQEGDEGEASAPPAQPMLKAERRAAAAAEARSGGPSSDARAPPLADLLANDRRDFEQAARVKSEPRRPKAEPQPQPQPQPAPHAATAAIIDLTD